MSREREGETLLVGVINVISKMVTAVRERLGTSWFRMH